jgi:hypothetical protein
MKENTYVNSFESIKPTDVTVRKVTVAILRTGIDTDTDSQFDRSV